MTKRAERAAKYLEQVTLYDLEFLTAEERPQLVVALRILRRLADRPEVDERPLKRQVKK